MSDRQVFRTKVSQGFQVVVPAELRKKHGIGVGDEVIWIVEGEDVKADFRKKPSLESIVSLGRGGGDAVETKKRAQKGEL